MLKIVTSELAKLGQSFLDEISDVDWGDERPGEFEVPGRISPHGDQGVIDERNYEDYEPAAAEDPIEEQLPTETTPPMEPPYQEEIPRGNELLGIPKGTREIEYDNSQQLVYDGIDNNDVITFDYTNRHGQYAGTRTVEPHYTFVATTTGNEVLVTFDRDQNDIRAFIIGNIHPYGVRYEEVKFEPRGKIMKGIQ